MNTRQLQGWALVLAAVLNLVGLVGFLIGSDSIIFRIVNLVGGVLFIVGIPAILSAQRMGTAGLIGVILLELAALVALVLNLLALTGATAPGEILPLASAVAGAIGAVIVGWLTTRETVFPQWAGWAFILQGLLNLIGPLFGSGPLAAALAVIGTLAGAAALLGYGFAIARRPVR
ncbi:MAG: hypothetical protein ACM3JD_18080 [Rudaea sp.]